MAVGSRSAVDDSTPAGRLSNEAGAARSLSILFVAPSWPYPPTWGFATRVYHLARQLSKRHHVSFLAYKGANSEVEPTDAFRDFRSVELVAQPPAFRSKRRAQAASLLSPRSYHMAHLRSARMSAAVNRALDRHAFDLVQVESSQMGLAAIEPGIPLVLDEHNVEFLLLRRLASIESAPWRKAFGYLEALKARRDELRSWKNCDGAVFASESDMALMRAAQPEKPACVVPNGVDTDYFHPSSVEPEPATIVFTGAINYRPNTDGVAYCIREVMPILRRIRPSVRFVVVGQGAPDWLIRMAGPNVEFTGAVDDVRPYLSRAAVVIAPLRAGSGTRLKILEALAVGKPVVSTRVGREGLAVADGEHLIVADDPVSFAQQTARLISDRRLADELGRRGRALVERQYSWSAIAGRLESFHSTLIQKERRV